MLALRQRIGKTILGLFFVTHKTTAIMSNITAVGYEDMLCIEGVILLRQVLLLVRVGL